MSDLPPLPSEDINDGEIRVFTYRHLREYAAIARQQGRDEMREWNASRVRDEPTDEQIDEALEAWFASGPVGADQKTDRTRMRAAIAAAQGKSAEGEGA